MADGEEYIKFNESISKDKDSALKEVQEINIVHVGSWRSFTGTLLTIDIAVVAALVAALSVENQTLIHVPWMAVIGTVLLILDAIFIVFYCTVVLLAEDKSLSNRRAFLNSSYSDMQQMGLKYLQENKPFAKFRQDSLVKMREFAAQERKISEESAKGETSPVWLAVLSSLFITSIVVIVFSLIPYSDVNTFLGSL